MQNQSCTEGNRDSSKCRSIFNGCCFSEAACSGIVKEHKWQSCGPTMFAISSG